MSKKSATKHAAACLKQAVTCFTKTFILKTFDNFFKVCYTHTRLLSLYIALEEFILVVHQIN